MKSVKCKMKDVKLFTIYVEKSFVYFNIFSEIHKLKKYL